MCTAGLFDVQQGCLGKTSFLISNSTDSNSDKSVKWFLCKLCNRSLTFYLAVIGIIFKLKGFKAFQVKRTTKFHRDAWGWNCLWEGCNNWNRLHTLFLLNDGLKFSYIYIIFLWQAPIRIYWDSNISYFAFIIIKFIYLDYQVCLRESCFVDLKF